MKTTCVTLAVLAAVQFASAGVIIDAATRNGGFESASKTAYATPWKAFGEVKPASTGVKTGKYACGLGKKAGVNKGIYQNTAHRVAATDSFELSFAWAAGYKWQKKNTVNYTLFTTQNNTYAGARTVVLSGAVTGKKVNAEYGPVVRVKSFSIPAASVGKKLWLEFAGTCENEQFCRLDDVKLTVSSVAK